MKERRARLSMLDIKLRGYDLTKSEKVAGAPQRAQSDLSAISFAKNWEHLSS